MNYNSNTELQQLINMMVDATLASPGGPINVEDLYKKCPDLDTKYPDFWTQVSDEVARRRETGAIENSAPTRGGR